jgi:hypothetical protein
MPQPQPSPDSLMNRDSNGAATKSSGTEVDAMLYCPVCSKKLESRKCKLFCAQCGYYMSCADYY